MSGILSEYDKVFDKLKKEGKVIFLEGVEHQKRMDEMNKRAEETKKDYQAKERNSLIASATIVLR